LAAFLGDGAKCRETNIPQQGIHILQLIDAINANGLAGAMFLCRTRGSWAHNYDYPANVVWQAWRRHLPCSSRPGLVMAAMGVAADFDWSTWVN
jgi:hypothetical protein